ncbi:hypothetical protein DWF00_06830 [Bosea caraganae]|uniref:Uncharacterized protein n=1 Tax=Bosea caraganae TaxID=2763117 RepID=A0A370L516_9HYPH|nr:hypothetical protein [Bosea caraganae]RDJ23065.1 hypothetical protein DWE98_18075 [Bosea caraganae]RDJ28845.1 hypothetical protein DWF00_06830 [Bosea caraganae]
MSDARSLTPLSETDYEAIASAVMETARGRWFMTEFAKRNRQADTAQVLAAINKLQRTFGAAPAQQPTGGADLRDAITLIMELRTDLERIGGGAGEPSSRLAARIEGAASSVIGATESIQEAAWGLREAGASDALCDTLDRRATEIYGATAIIEATAQQLGKIADTIAMLDSSLRAFAEGAHETPNLDVVPAASSAPARAPDRPFDLREAAPLSSYDDIEIVEIDDRQSALSDSARTRTEPSKHRRFSSMQIIDEDLVFSETGGGAASSGAVATSEDDLRAIDALPASGKLAYFA